MNHAHSETIYLRDYQVPEFLIEKTALRFVLEEAYTTVTATLHIRKNPASSTNLGMLVLQGQELELISLACDGEYLDAGSYEKTATELKIFSVNEDFLLTIVTRIKPHENTALSGLYQSSNNYCTQCEAHGFRRITYYLDRPDVMARFTTEIIADKKQYPLLLSNGNLIEKKDLDNGKHYVKWEDPFKKPCYLFALVAGDFESIEDVFQTCEGRSVQLRLYVEKGNRDKALFAMDALKKAMRWDEEKYGRAYDLDIYMIVAVSDFNAGAMENKGLNIFNTQYILAKPTTATDMDYIMVESVIAHEYFHNWTGNRVTCRDWFQLSLKEGLTVFRDQSFTEDTTSKTVTRIDEVDDLRNSQFIEDAGPLKHPVRPESYEEINNFYTATVYNKGAELIRMQKTILGDDLFRKGMDLYFKRHDGEAVTIEDFVKAMEDASQISLDQFRLWYSEAGTPVLDVKDNYDANAKRYTLTIKQDYPKPLHIPVKIGLLNREGKTIHEELLQVKKPEETFHFDNIESIPIPSLLREFSAPVKVNYDYADADLEFLFKYDSDLFNRWDAGQRYAVHLILRLIKDFSNNQTLVIPKDYIETFQYLLESGADDKLILAELITLPSEKYIGEQMSQIDVDAIHAARQFVVMELAKNLKSHFIQLYEKNNDLNKPYQFNMTDVGKRRLTGRALYYLSRLNDQNIHDNIILPHFEKALSHNMTDTMMALGCIVNSPLKGREEALNQFYQKFSADALVIDKWLALQASSEHPDTLANVRQLTEHAAFDIKNPNKVYALIGAFGRNMLRFHEADGKGYQFLKDKVLQLNDLNPQIAARMVKPLSDWKRYDDIRKEYMKKTLQSMLAHKNLSKDLKELVSKSLGETK